MFPIVLNGQRLPCVPCSCRKAPLAEHGWLDATTDPERYAELLAAYPGAPLIGVATTMITVLDIDRHDPSEDGFAWLRENAHRIPKTRTHHTGGGGLHLIFELVLGMRSRKVAPGVEFKSGTGSGIVWWPAAGLPVTWGEVVEQVPDWLRGASSSLVSPMKKDASPGKPCANFEFEPRTTRTEAQVRSYYLLRTVENAPIGNRNNTIYWAACRFREMVARGEITEVVVEELLLASCRVLFGEPVWPAVRATIRSGLRGHHDLVKAPAHEKGPGRKTGS